MNLITWIAASWRKHFTSTDVTSCANQGQCPVCVAIVLPSNPLVFDWCAKCGADIYHVPVVGGWFNGHGRYACFNNALKGHVPLLAMRDDRVEREVASGQRVRPSARALQAQHDYMTGAHGRRA